MSCAYNTSGEMQQKCHQEENIFWKREKGSRGNEGEGGREKGGMGGRRYSRGVRGGREGSGRNKAEAKLRP